MTPSTDTERRDRTRAFVSDLIPEPIDLDRSGPLNAREQRDLARIHEARDNYQNAKWMRGMALESAFKRQLYRGENGQRTRQEYLDDEWDGMSESAAYLEIGEWRLAARISAAYDRPAPDSHVRGLLPVTETHSLDVVAQWYADVRRHGEEKGLRVTAEVVKSLAAYLTAGGELPELDAVFTPRQLPPAPRKPSEPARQPTRPEVDPSKRETGTEEAEEGAEEEQAPFQIFGTGEGSVPGDGSSKADRELSAAGEPWLLDTKHVSQLSSWIVAQARDAGITPAQAADLLMEALTRYAGATIQQWIRSQTDS